MMENLEEFFGNVYGYFDKATNKEVYIISIDFIEKSVTIMYYEGNRETKGKRNFKDILAQPHDFY